MTLAVSFGAGTNSTAMLCGFVERGVRPDFITFADTGAEMPHTYEHLTLMQGRVAEWWGLTITVVRKLYKGEFEGLEGQCVRRSELPGLAYGRKSCSIKYKGEPQDRALKAWAKERAVDLPVTKAIGFDAGETRRHRPTSAAPDLWAPWYPLLDWGWRREDCVDAITRHGISLPGKSACYFCPASKKGEVQRLREEHPDLYAKAIAIEDAAQPGLKTDRGLGGNKNRWRDWSEAHDAGKRPLLDISPMHEACGCYDG